jgi:hypothetical protein
VSSASRQSFAASAQQFDAKKPPFFVQRRLTTFSKQRPATIRTIPYDGINGARWMLFVVVKKKMEKLGDE